MIKIAMVMTSLNTGGIATSIKNLLVELSKRGGYQIDLILFHTEEVDKKAVPDCVHIYTPGKVAELIAISQTEARNKGISYSMLRLFLGAICRTLGHGLAYRLIFAKSKKYGEYDAAISCTQSGKLKSLYGGCNEFVLHNISAKQKIAFIHCDYVTYGINDKYSRKIYKQFDKIAAVSESVKKVFLREEPEFASKTFTVLNCYNFEQIKNGTNVNPYRYNPTVINFVTIARMGREKGHLRVLKGLCEAKKEGAKFLWHIIGGSEEEAPSDFVDKAIELGIYDNLVFHGNQVNPYKYLVNADFLLVPSYHEAAPMVYGEAFILGVPVLTTNTISAIEMVQNNKAGIVCENSDIGITDMLQRVLSNPSLLKKYRYNLKNYNGDNRLAIEQFINLIQGEGV